MSEEYSPDYISASPSSIPLSNFASSIIDDGDWEKTLLEEGKANIIHAMEYAEFGIFQMLLLIPCILAFASLSMVPSILNKFLVTIQCEYQLHKYDMIAINDAVYTCLVLGSVCWAILGDGFSRKWSLMFALTVNAFAALGIGISDTFLAFGIFRGLFAFSLSGIEILTVTYIAEFQNRHIRGTMITYLHLGWICGLLSIPELDFSWYERVLLAAFPPFLAALGLLFFPDSSRFWLSKKNKQEAIKSLQVTYAINTWKDGKDFPVKYLRDYDTPEEIKRRSIVSYFVPSVATTKLHVIVFLMLSQFTLMFSYRTMAIWFKDMIGVEESLFPVTRYHINVPYDCEKVLEDLTNKRRSDNAKFHTSHHFSKNISKLTKDALKQHSRKVKMSEENPCYRRNVRYSKLYGKQNMLITFACVPSIIFLLIYIDKVAKHIFIVFSHTLLGLLCFVSFFMHTKAQELIFACLFEALALISHTAGDCIAVTLFSTKYRAAGVAVVIVSGYLGLIMGNLGFALAFSAPCVSVVTTIAFALLVSGLLTIPLPQDMGIILR